MMTERAVTVRLLHPAEYQSIVNLQIGYCDLFRAAHVGLICNWTAVVKPCVKSLIPSCTSRQFYEWNSAAYFSVTSFLTSGFYQSQVPNPGGGR